MKKFQFTCLVSILIFAAIFSSCKKDKTLTPVDLGYGYFPSDVGHFVIYEVDSTYYYDDVNNAFDEIINVKFQMKEVIDTVYQDGEKRPTLYISRYKRYYDPSIPYEQLPWEIAQAVAANVTSSTAEVVEENQRYIKLIFPTLSGKKWNGNAFNAQDSWTYQYSAVDQPKTLGFTFDSTLTVLQTGLNDPVINTQLSTEVYAKHVGLIYKSYKVVQYLPDTSGSEYTMTVIDYSK